MLPGWENFAVISGSAAGALTGLLFVAVSLNRDRIVGHAALRSEAGQTLVLFLLALFLSLLLVIPGTSPRLLDRLARLLDTVSPNLIAMLSITVSGCLEIAGDNGLYWLAAAVVLALGGGVINAWLFLTR